MEDYCLGLRTDYFDRPEIRVLEAMEDGDRLVLFHLRLLVLCDSVFGEYSGVPEKIAALVNEDVDFVINAIGEFEKLGLVEFESEEVFYLTDFWDGLCYFKKCPDLRDRNSAEYRNWRKAVFERDKYCCQKCGAYGVNLQAHHIKGWAKWKDLRYVVSNGITLCRDCHKEEHRRGK